MNITVVGGDVRYLELVKLLRRDGNAVEAVGFEKAGEAEVPCEKLKTACAGADCVVLPAPAFLNNGTVNAPLSAEDISVENIAQSIGGGTVVFAGGDRGRLKQAGGEDLDVVDYLNLEQYAVANAMLTAEGAVQVLLNETKRSLSGARVLVTGYGRIGKLLCRRLQGMDAYVTASARKQGDIAMIRAMGLRGAWTERIEDLDIYDIVINTVPSPVLGRRELERAKGDCIFLELASLPGGIDTAAARELGIKVIAAGGLPGKRAPVTAAEIIRDTIYNIMCEKGKTL
ncbi:MAG: dipicolinate synthase [Oscillospiraceae bacterium]|nr:dipicolinate synthase [Oscillospiraceae bacterium]